MPLKLLIESCSLEILSTKGERKTVKDFIFLNTLTKKTFVIKYIVFNFEKKFNKKKFNTVLLGILAKTIN